MDTKTYMDMDMDEVENVELDSTFELLGNIILLFFLVLVCECYFQSITER